MPDENGNESTPINEIFSDPGASDSSSSPSESVKATEPDDSQSSSESDSSSPDPGEQDSSQEKGEETSSEKPPEKSPADSKPAEKEDGKSADSAEKKDEPKAEIEVLRQRHEDTVRWAQQVHQQNLQMQRQLEAQAKQLTKLQKQADGTWTEEDEAAENRGATTEDVATRAVQIGKAVASKASAIREIANTEFQGDVNKATERVNSELLVFQQLAAINPVLHSVVGDAESPVHEAMNVVERFRFEQQYGSNPRAIKAAIIAEFKPAFEKELRKSILEEIRGNKKQAAATPETLANKGSGDRADSARLKEGDTTPLSDIFGTSL